MGGGEGWRESGDYTQNAAVAKGQSFRTSNPEAQHLEWMELYNELKTYLCEHGVVPSEVDKDDALRKIGNWAREQRRYRANGDLLPEREKLLDKLKGKGWKWVVETGRRSSIEGYIIYDYREKALPELEEVRKLAREAEAKGKSAAFIHEDLRKLAAFSKGRTVEDDEIPGLARGRSDRWTDSTKKLREALEAFGSL